ncbi:Putative flippase GtrA (transmembrane translocase of bactoprenol-linked glucose) [Ruminococcaceae bacterium D5]|jgi:putative flippase GtrA|nr:GtrA family protein [Faecalicatena sp. BF-R-105]SFJ62028.1 Putative flippase GtrA (transmembrane translocase of bactoprenol-linked glucose) [Ruminococcaceae bacterium D5]
MRQVSGIRIFDRTILKFLIVGVVNTLFGTAVMFSLYNLAGCSYWISSAANYILGSILSFFLNKYFTFQNKERPWRQVVRFTVNIAACYLVAYGVAKPAVRMLLSGQSVSIQENAAMLVGMCLFTGLNYFGQRFFAFR